MAPKLVALIAAAWLAILAAAAVADYPAPVACECDSDGDCERRCS